MKKKLPIKKIMEKQSALCPSFEIVSGKVRVTDPGYDKDTFCSAEVTKVKNGTWFAWAKKTDESGFLLGPQCSDLFVWHSQYSKDEVFGTIQREEGEGVENEYDVVTGGMGQVEINSPIGVDSGQAGVFDSKFFKDDHSVQGLQRICGEAICPDELWYSMCCDRTINENRFGTIPYGAVSSSGGDGIYVAYKCLNMEKEVVGIRIVFL